MVWLTIPFAPGTNALPNITAYPALRDRLPCKCFNRATHPQLLARLFSGDSIDSAIAWARNELEGFIR